ncbi:MAG: hemerythrin family protein [Ilumatobacteraceae bacterium]
MTTFVWTNRLEVGFPEMDAQHQRLIALMADLNRELEEGASRAECLATLDELGERSVRHFAEEEQVMMEVGFPRIDHHQILHTNLLERFSDHRDELARPAGVITPAFITFLNGWLTGHILGPDTQYGVYSGRLTRRG